MKEKLTPKEIRLMKKTRDEWLNRFFSCTNRTNRKQATKQIEWLYSLANLEKPKVIFLDSPLGIQYGGNMLKRAFNSHQVWDQVGAQVRAQVWAQVWAQVGDQVGDQVWDQVGYLVRVQVWAQVGDQVGDQVRAQVGDQVRAQVWAQVWAQVGDQVRAQKLEWFDTTWYYYGSVADYGWVAFYEYFNAIGIKIPKDLLEQFNNFAFLLKSNIYEMIMLKGFCIVSDMPTVIKRDQENRLHNQEGAAIEFKDGYKQFFYHGTAVKEQWILHPEKLTKKDWLDEENLEKRRIIQELMRDSFPKKIGSKLIAKPSKEFKEKHHLLGLYEVELPNDPEKVAHYIRVQDHSSNRQYYLRVDPKITDCDEALAWTFSMSSKDYRPLQET